MRQAWRLLDPVAVRAFRPSGLIRASRPAFQLDSQFVERSLEPIVPGFPRQAAAPLGPRRQSLVNLDPKRIPPKDK